jgi:hypothetical protein
MVCELGPPGDLLAKAKINGRPITAAEREVIGKAGLNDVTACAQIAYQDAQIANERAQLTGQLDALLGKYGFFASEDHTLGQIRDAMTPQDAAELDRLCEVLFPDGYMYLKGLGD